MLRDIIFLYKTPNFYRAGWKAALTDWIDFSGRCGSSLEKSSVSYEDWTQDIQIIL